MKHWKKTIFIGDDSNCCFVILIFWCFIVWLGSWLAMAIYVWMLELWWLILGEWFWKNVSAPNIWIWKLEYLGSENVRWEEIAKVMWWWLMHSFCRDGFVDFDFWDEFLKWLFIFDWMILEWHHITSVTLLVTFRHLFIGQAPIDTQKWWNCW